MTYEAALSALYKRNEFSIKLGLENINTLLSRLNRPDKDYPIVHIAGTNGKGSVASMIASVLQAAGYKTGLYTSPHLIDFRERIQVNQKLISQSDVLSGLKKIEKVIVEQKQNFPDFEPTYFEVVTALALSYFKQAQVDIAILETGLGGRLDSTNICQPILSVITNVSVDHSNLLGKRLKEIANEKAGIIKKQIPVVIGERRPIRRKWLLDCANEKNAPVFIPPLIERSFEKRFDFRLADWNYTNLEVPLLGAFAIENAFTALTALKALSENNFHLTETSLRKGLKHCYWPGRCQLILKEPLLLLDGAHNLEGINQLLSFIRTKCFPQPVAVFGAMKDKPAKEMLAKIANHFQEIYLVQARSNRAMPVLQLKAALLQTGFRGKIHDQGSITDVLAGLIPSASQKKQSICLFGSLYIVGEALKYIQSQNEHKPVHPIYS